ncbi:hypothetical protein EH32_02965 [Erythrobacter litoralis]|jgi:hypothetical protein|uniref:Uncharacterized protein n=1 Tax=Erythrobacter litoralis TaxID=39960 RepID=A0A074MB15_9SPHN|nr:hypothetical protein EH32_02965 [Erythrobacter litoralis]
MLERGAHRFARWPFGIESEAAHGGPDRAQGDEFNAGPIEDLGADRGVGVDIGIGGGQKAPLSRR